MRADRYCRHAVFVILRPISQGADVWQEAVVR
jgi:hypothetical protein